MFDNTGYDNYETLHILRFQFVNLSTKKIPLLLNNDAYNRIPMAYLHKKNVYLLFTG